MPDREKVIGHLQIIRTWNEVGKAYAFDESDKKEKAKTVEWIDDALELLKEQEAKPVKVVKNAYNHEFYYCPRCDRSFYELFVKPKFCDKCGQAVKWEKLVNNLSKPDRRGEVGCLT